MNVLVTGGAGYVGSVCALELRRLGHRVVAYDNLATGHRSAIASGVAFVKGDLAATKTLEETCRRHRINLVMHFAANIEVGESVRDPALYYRNNVGGTLSLLEVMARNKIRSMIFSSSAAVYGEPERTPITESHPLSPISPYGETKLIIEKALRWYHQAYGLNSVSLRYFNASGAAGGLGEAHHPETHLLPRILDAALDSARPLRIYGDDYPTPDGTCVRDFVHVLDIARAHVLAMQKLPKLGYAIYNVGHGKGYSILEVIRAVEAATGTKINAKIGKRRAGDPAVLVASPRKISRELGWKPLCSDLPSIVRSAWEWHRKARIREGSTVGKHFR